MHDIRAAADGAAVKKVSGTFFGVSRTATGAKRGFQFQSAGGLIDPGCVAQRTPAPDAVANRRDFRFCLRSVDMLHPTGGTANGPCAQKGLFFRRAVDISPETAPPPLLGPRDEPGPQRVAFNVSTDGEEMLVILRGK